MPVIRYAASALVGIGAFALAIAALFIMIYAIYVPLELWDAVRAGAGTRRLLAWLAFALVAGPASAVLAGVPFLAARRWGTSAPLALIVAMVLGGLAADTAVKYLSYANDCTLQHSFPYGGAECNR